ncbi:DUF4333 domain-containing protein [Mycolicibacterium sp. 050158]|uniref:DUF4333 domain-containing protein n=1 Tax=Mycolicibacterium sp. 050158 TaxID=3090602 RepID=UPI00299D15E6|nr:DUF4333 domain-containing protein [Mycolicibacterium sp. 050158]MDX1892906.1 DUF4333 domain-containing protein [Mycolicibacterium sp. 050158]
MSGPQGSDPNQPWSGQPPSDPAWQPQAPEQPQPEQPGWGQQPPAYGQQPPAYGGQQYQQPPYGQPQYPQADQYSQQPTAYGPSSYPQQSPYAPQPPYGQQPYGQPQPGQYDPNQPYGQPPGQYDPNQQFSPYSTTDAGSKKSKGVVLGVVGALAAVILIVVGVLGFWKPGWFVTTNLDVKAAQSGVQQILSDQTNGYGAKNVQDVTCNHGANPKVVKGGTFDCEVSIDGTKRQVTVTFQDDSGTYEVGRPR